MQIIEIKNNLVKITFEPATEKLILSGFVIVMDETQSFIGQIINLEATAEKNTAIIKLLFTFDAQGVISGYNGATPSINSQINIIFARELLELFVAENPIYFGELAQQDEKLALDRTVFDQKTVICIEKQEEKDLLTSNFIKQLVAQGAKVLALDFLGNLDYPENTIVAGKDFKLPLDYDTINFIYEKGLDDASGETKATIQEVFLEVQNYVKTLPEQFLPFENFKAVVDAQYEETELVELLLLKNKLLKYYDEGIFAQEENDFKSLANHIDAQDLTVLNLANVDEKIQREMIAYAYSVIESQDKPVYILINLDNENADKKLLKCIYTAKKAISIVSCQYSFKYMKELKQLSKNVLMFAPIQQQNDFGGYNIFLNKLNNKEYLIYGESTHHMPLIVTLKEIPEDFQCAPKSQEQSSQTVQEEQNIQNEPVATVEPKSVEIEEQENPQQEEILEDEILQVDAPIEIEEEPIIEEEQVIEEQVPTNVEMTQEEILDEQIRRDVDEFYTAPQSSTENLENNSEEDFGVEVLQDDDSDLLADGLTDDDLDFIQESLSDNMFDDEAPVQPQGVPQSLPVAEGNESFAQVMENEAFQTEHQLSASEILPQDAANTPIVPVYSAEAEPQVPVQSDDLAQGDNVVHAKYGKGVVEKLISYGDKTLYSINFDNVGRRLLDPNVTEIKKV